MPVTTTTGTDHPTRLRRVSAPVKSSQAQAVLAKEPPKTVRRPEREPAKLPPADSTAESKKLSRRGSKPFINWFQRKLGGSRARRASEAGVRPPIPSFAEEDAAKEAGADNEGEGGGGGEARVGKPHANGHSKLKRPVTLPPVALPPPAAPLALSNSEPASAPPTRLNAISLNTDDDGSDEDRDDGSINPSSLAPESTWSPSTAPEADEDASLRPIPPSMPPSPSPSHAPSYSSSSYLSDPRTFRSTSASTKPTTVLSLDLPAGPAHIAQAPPITPLPAARVANHGRTPTAGSITFSTLPAQPSHPSSLRNVATLPAGSENIPDDDDDDDARGAQVQAPNHTLHHPRDNPRPSSPPQDDASVLTLASSAFAVPGARGANAVTWHGANAGGSVSILNGGGTSDSHSQLDGTGSFRDEDANETWEGQMGASVRALRSRRSWESEASRWSARVGGGAGPLTPGDGKPAIFGANSFRTGGFSAEDEKTRSSWEAAKDTKPDSTKEAANGVKAEPTTNGAHEDEVAPIVIVPAKEEQGSEDDLLGPPTATASDVDATPCIRGADLPPTEPPVTPDPATPNASIAKVHHYFDRPEHARKHSDGADSPSDSGTEGGHQPPGGYEASIAATDAQTDAFYSAPGTPMGWD